MRRTAASVVHGSGVSFVWTEAEISLVGGQLTPPEGCTSIAVARGDKVTNALLTHTADCLDCDFRLASVPAKQNTKGKMRPVYLYRPQYPHLVVEDRAETWTAAHLEADKLPQRHLWNPSKPIGEIPEVDATHAILEAIYGIANDAGVAIGESTCAGRFYSLPATDGGAALLDVSELTRIGLERASTARECVQIMGELAEMYGFYGSDWNAGGEEAFLEAGESLVVADPTEVFIFHIIPDDTGAGALWVAQRVPPGHVAVLANQFIIRNVPQAGEAGSEDFMWSSNLWDVAAAHGLWDPLGNEQLDFAAAFQPQWSYSDRLATRRVWRVFNLLAPEAAAALPSTTTGWDDDYPFSIAVERDVNVADMLALNRDHYEGTQFDMTKDLAAGPYGDPTRAGLGASLDGTVTDAEAMAGAFERPIALHRTSISTAVELRPIGEAGAAPETAAAVWVSQYHPAMAAAAPMYAACAELPRAYTVGSLFRYDPASSFWNFAAVGNYATRWYTYMQPEIAATATALESSFIADQPAVEAAAAAAFRAGDAATGRQLLTDFSQRSGDSVSSAWRDLLPSLLARFHDGYRLQDPEAETVGFDRFFYPRSWLTAVGYWGKNNERLAGLPGEAVGAAPQPQVHLTRSQFVTAVSALSVVSASLGYALAWRVARRAHKRRSYDTIAEEKDYGTRTRGIGGSHIAKWEGC